MKILNNQFDRKKLINILVIILLLVALLLIFGSSLGDLGGLNNTNPVSNEALKQTASAKGMAAKNTSKGSDYAQEIDGELESILSQMKGVGKVKVMVTLETDDEVVPAMDSKQDNQTTSENDKTGTIRSTTQKNTENSIVILNKQSGDNSALILRKIKPKIKGVIVVAEGAGNEQTQYNISKACEVALDVEPDKVQVFEKN